MQTETLQQKAMQDIFALDDAVSQFESFGSQLDLGLPQAEDDTPKSFEDMLEVNPSNEPMEYGENFMSEGDDLQDKQTQKFVVDEFAKEAAKLPDGGITAADITGISAVIQMNNHITGDVRSFIQQTIDHAVQAQQQQNVSDALPNGTVAQDIAKTGDAGADVGMAPVDGGIPPMEPIDPTAEPSLEPNPDASMDDLSGDPLADMPGADNLGDINDSLDAEGGDAPLGDENNVAADADAGVPEADSGVPAADEAEPAAADSDLDSFLDSDDDLDKDADLDSDKEEPVADAAEDKGAEDGKDKGSEDDSDDDFNFEAIATKANGLVENQEAADVPADTDASSDVTADAGVAEGDAAASADEGEGGEEAITSCDNRSVEAKVESIVSHAKMKIAADKAKSILEAYDAHRERAKTLAKLESVVSDLKKTTATESIISNYAKESRKQAALEAACTSIKKTQKTAPSVFESTMAKIDNALASTKKTSVQAAADKVIAAFEAEQKSNKTLETKLDNILESIADTKMSNKDSLKQSKINAMVESAAAKVAAESKLSSKLNSILEGVQKSQAASKASKELDMKLDAIVKEVKGA